MTLVQISDLHITEPGRRLHGVIDSAGFLRAAVDRINAFTPQPDAVIATGDLVDGGSAAEYRCLERLLEPLRAPIFLLGGNHDRRDALRSVFGGMRYVPSSGPLQYVLDLPVRVVAIDTAREGHSGGELDRMRLEWIDATLSQAARPTIIAMHHPPFPSGIAGMDGHGFFGVEQFATIVRRHPHVEQVVCGHIHRSMFVRWAGTLASICPSTAHQLVLDFSDEARVRFVLEPPGLHLHRWDGERLTTHVVPITQMGRI